MGFLGINGRLRVACAVDVATALNKKPTTNRVQSSLLELPKCEGGKQTKFVNLLTLNTMGMTKSHLLFYLGKNIRRA